VPAKFIGAPRKDQKAALSDLITRRKVSTLVLVHRNELMRQWQERLGWGALCGGRGCWLDWLSEDQDGGLR
jgi:hypothetical protein